MFCSAGVGTFRADADILQTIPIPIPIPIPRHGRLAYQSAQASSLAAALKADIAQGLADVHAGRVGAVDVQAIKEKGRAVLRSKSSI